MVRLIQWLSPFESCGGGTCKCCDLDHVGRHMTPALARCSPASIDLVACSNSRCLRRLGGVSSHRGRLAQRPHSPRFAVSQRAACAHQSRVSLTALLRIGHPATTSPTRARGSPSTRSAARASGPGSAGGARRAVGGGATARTRPKRGRQCGERTARDVCAMGLWCGGARGRIDGAERTICGRVWFRRCGRLA